MAAKNAEKPEDGKTAHQPRKIVLLLAVVVLAALGAGGYFFAFGGGKSEAATAPKPGVVVKLDSINLNLADGHYLKLGLALQATKDATVEQIDGSRALDEAIGLFTGRSMSELSNAVTRDKIKAILVGRVGKLYENKVIDVYFTEFVMQ